VFFKPVRRGGSQNPVSIYVYRTSAIMLVVMAGFTEKKQALHDIIAGTLVLDKNPAYIHSEESTKSADQN